LNCFFIFNGCGKPDEGTSHGANNSAYQAANGYRITLSVDGSAPGQSESRVFSHSSYFKEAGKCDAISHASTILQLIF
jgi:hypothetical protein